MAKQVDPAAMEGAVPESAQAPGPLLAAEGSQVSPVQPASNGAVRTSGLPPSQLGPFPAFHGRRVSWIAVSIIMAGFLIGGLAMVFGHQGPIWWLFWTGAGISAVGLLTTLATNTFEDWY